MTRAPIINEPAPPCANPLDQLTHHVKLFDRESARKARADRNREILRLARRGLTNREIAARVDLSHQHVGRIVRAALV